MRVKQEADSLAVLRELVLFALAGVLGFLVDTAVLYLLRDTAGLYAGRAASFACAATATWLVNRAITFAERRSGVPAHVELSWYLLLMLGGGSVNYGVYALLVAKAASVASEPIWGVAAGSVSGMLVNFALSRAFLFHGRRG